MRIDLNARTGEAPDAGRPNKPAARGPSPARREALGNDEAQLSFDQARLLSLEAQVNSVPEIRQGKVESLGRAIRDGNYQTAPEATADAMVSHMLARRALR